MKIIDVKVEVIHIPMKKPFRSRSDSHSDEEAVPYCICRTGSFCECSGKSYDR